MGRLRIARRELASLRSEKTIVLALLIQLFIAAFSSFLLVGLVSLYDPGGTAANVTVGVSGPEGDDLAAAIRGEGNWEVREFEDAEAAREAFAGGAVDTAFIATQSGDGSVGVEAIVPDESVRSTLIVVQVREALQVYERALRDDRGARLTRAPLPVPDVPATSPTFAFTYTVLLPLLLFLPGFISGSVAADAVTEELDAGTFELLRVTPLTPTAIVDGKMLAMAGLAPVQAATWLALLVMNGTEIANLVPLLVVAAAIATVLVAVGTALALVLGDRQSTQLVYSLAVLVAFAAASLAPQNPANLIARLAIGSPNGLTTPILLGYVVAAVVALLAARVVIGRVFPAARRTAPNG